MEGKKELPEDLYEVTKAYLEEIIELAEKKARSRTKARNVQASFFRVLEKGE